MATFVLLFIIMCQTIAIFLIAKALLKKIEAVEEIAKEANSHAKTLFDALDAHVDILEEKMGHVQDTGEMSIAKIKEALIDVQDDIDELFKLRKSTENSKATKLASEALERVTKLENSLNRGMLLE